MQRVINYLLFYFDIGNIFITFDQGINIKQPRIMKQNCKRTIHLDYEIFRIITHPKTGWLV